MTSDPEMYSLGVLIMNLSVEAIALSSFGVSAVVAVVAVSSLDAPRGT